MYAFESETTTPLDTLDASGAANTHPIVLDANGEAEIYLQDYVYTLVLTDDTGSAVVGPTGEGVIQDRFPVDGVTTDLAAAKLLIAAIPATVSLSDVDPLAAGPTAEPGAGSDASREDHVHPLLIPATGLPWLSNDAGTELITTLADQDFSSSTGNWSGTNWTITGGVGSHTADGANAFTLVNTALSAAPSSGKTYRIQATIVTSYPGTISIGFGGATVPANGEDVGTQTAFTAILVATSNAALVFTPSAAWRGTIDNVSVKEVIAGTTQYTIKLVDGVPTVFA
jgi:hypothetical protein